MLIWVKTLEALAGVIGWVWEYKTAIVALLLSLSVVGLVHYADQVSKERDDAVVALQTYKIDVATKAKAQEAQWIETFAQAQDEYDERIKALERSSAELNTINDRMSVALSEAKRKSATASAEARAELLDTLNVISGQCISEYRTMARYADEHAADAKRLVDIWPVDKPP